MHIIDKRFGDNMRVLVSFLFLVMFSGALEAQSQIRCGKEAPQIKAFVRAATRDLSEQLQNSGFQRIKISVATRLRSISTSVRASNTSGTFGVALSYDLSNLNQIKINAASTAPDSQICSYKYNITISARYLNTDGKSVGRKSLIENQEFLAPLIYTVK